MKETCENLNPGLNFPNMECLPLNTCMKLCVKCIELNCQATFVVVIGADEVSSSKSVIYFATVKSAVFCEIRWIMWSDPEMDNTLVKHEIYVNNVQK